AAAGGDGSLAPAAAAGRRLRLLPGGGQDGRRPLPGLLVVLVPGRLLPVRAPAAARRVPAGAGDRTSPVDLRAQPVPVPDAARLAQPAELAAERAVGGGAGRRAVAPGGRFDARCGG